ncbi:hypothetical protein [Janthinobacterium sp. K2Li3]|uniref:hypothetical protein n=1 Tax=Janthinobacterium sp. K2Li3 TaxID=2723081 RepID=UPI0016165D76|nr:hypothetical protein [Janthinobacterium sp. K2Li3]
MQNLVLMHFFLIVSTTLGKCKEKDGEADHAEQSVVKLPFSDVLFSHPCRHSRSPQR